MSGGHEYLLERVFCWQDAKGAGEEYHDKNSNLANFDDGQIIITLQNLFFIHEFLDVRMISKRNITKQSAHYIGATGHERP